MNAPALVARRFLLAVAWGGAAGGVYGFLRQPRQRHPYLCDLIFTVFLFWAWLQVSFAVCRGDIRLSYTAGLFAGVLLEEATLGRVFQPVFRGFWKALAWLSAKIRLPFKIFFKNCRHFINFLFASWKKWGTIKWN